MTEIERLKDQDEKRKARIKAQNESAKERWETVSCRLPKGTKQFFVDRGYTLNGIINELIQREIERITNNEQHEARNAETEPAQIQQATRATDPQEIQDKQNTKPAPAAATSLEELNAQLEQRRQEWQAVKPLLQEEEPGEDATEDLTPETLRAVAGAPDPEPVAGSIKDLILHAKQTVREEEEKRRQAAEQRRSEQENAVAQMLKSRS